PHTEATYDPAYARLSVAVPVLRKGGVFGQRGFGGYLCDGLCAAAWFWSVLGLTHAAHIPEAAKVEGAGAVVLLLERARAADLTVVDHQAFGGLGRELHGHIALHFDAAVEVLDYGDLLAVLPQLEVIPV